MLSAGTRLGPYEILSTAGAGGMGEVYKARDTRLDRIVAIKVLAQNLTGRPEVLQRFEREARAVSALNHPNICGLFDIGNENGAPYLVMEFVEGETLADRLTRGPLAITDTWHIAIQIGDALDQAHRRGIVHRDLKPGNVMLTGNTVKLLDFGLAKIAEAPPAPGSLTSLPTVVKSLTTEGTIVGTFQYMSPEQLEGAEAGHRSDIFAYGCVLYEMITGRKAFEGKSQATLISAIMTSEPPPISSMQPMSPPALDRLVRKCLAKDPDNRWQSARDLVSELRWITESGSQIAMAPVLETRRRWHARWGWIAAGLLGAAFLATAAITVLHLREKPPEEYAVRFQVPPGSQPYSSNMVPVLSPEGRRIVFNVGLGADQVLFVRSMDTLMLRQLPGTENGHFPFWSPDGRYIGFFAMGKMKKIDPAGGPPVDLCDVALPPGGAWNRDNVIVFSPTPSSPLMRVSAAGGTPTPVTKLDSGRGDTNHAWPSFLPDGRHFLFTVYTAAPGAGGVFLGSLDSPQMTRLLGDQTNAQYTPPGFILFTRGGTLTAQPFDAKQLRFTGDPFPIAEKIAGLVSPAGSAFSAAAGALAYRTGTTSAPSRMAWFDRKGARLSDLGEPADYSYPELSPDGRAVAVAERDPAAGMRDIWIFDLTRGTSSRLTFDPADDAYPLWSPDGQRIAFSSDRKRPTAVYQKSASGTGQEELVAQLERNALTECWTADGKYLIVEQYGSGKPYEDWAVPLFGDRKPFPLLTGPDHILRGRVSPDGKWIAYMFRESGKYQVYVQNFPPAGGKWLISPAGGASPRWRRDGKELFYLQGDKLMAVDVKTNAGRLEAGVPKALFEVPLIPRSSFAVTGDGQKFLMVTPAADKSADPITVVLNWSAALKH